MRSQVSHRSCSIHQRVLTRTVAFLFLYKMRLSWVFYDALMLLKSPLSSPNMSEPRKSDNSFAGLGMRRKNIVTRCHWQSRLFSSFFSPLGVATLKCWLVRLTLRWRRVSDVCTVSSRMVKLWLRREGRFRGGEKGHGSWLVMPMEWFQAWYVSIMNGFGPLWCCLLWMGPNTFYGQTSAAAVFAAVDVFEFQRLKWVISHCCWRYLFSLQLNSDNVSRIFWNRKRLTIICIGYIIF